MLTFNQKNPKTPLCPSDAKRSQTGWMIG